MLAHATRGPTSNAFDRPVTETTGAEASIRSISRWRVDADGASVRRALL